jgi:hypothetical protein
LLGITIDENSDVSSQAEERFRDRYNKRHVVEKDDALPQLVGNGMI